MKKWAKKNLWLIVMGVFITGWFFIIPEDSFNDSDWLSSPVKDLSVGDAIFLMIIYSAFRK